VSEETISLRIEIPGQGMTGMYTKRSPRYAAAVCQMTYAGSARASSYALSASSSVVGMRLMPPFECGGHGVPKLRVDVWLEPRQPQPAHEKHLLVARSQSSCHRARSSVARPWDGSTEELTDKPR
jgi:hypothetical protein